MSTPHRFLGFGFAAADLLLEIRLDGRVGFALGAGDAVLGVPDTKLTNRSWRSLIDRVDQPMVEALFAGLGDGVRSGPVVVAAEGAPERLATLTAVRLPQNQGAISCALARAAARAPRTSRTATPSRSGRRNWRPARSRRSNWPW